MPFLFLDYNHREEERKSSFLPLEEITPTVAVGIIEQIRLIFIKWPFVSE